jgi:hypothetical protein
MWNTGGMHDTDFLNWQISRAGRPESGPDLLSFYRGVDDGDFAPGIAWPYSKGGFLLLTAFIEHITGVLWPAGLSARLKLDLALSGEPDRPASIRVSDFVNVDELERMPPRVRADVSAVAGERSLAFLAAKQDRDSRSASGPNTSKERLSRQSGCCAKRVVPVAIRFILRRHLGHNLLGES